MIITTYKRSVSLLNLYLSDRLSTALMIGKEKQLTPLAVYAVDTYDKPKEERLCLLQS